MLLNSQIFNQCVKI